VEKKNEKDSIEIRAKQFKNSLIPYFKNPYDKDILQMFYDYWTEPNKSKTQLRFEMEKTWDLKRRLSYWDRNNKNFRGQNANPKRTREEIEQSAKDRFERVFSINSEESLN
jgi:hypothetical protein